MSDDAYMDPDLVTWTPTPALKAGECGHCNDPYRAGDSILLSADGRTLHDGCWELHTGYMEAMKKD